MIKCTSCGFENPDRNKFCQACGVEIATTIPAIATSSPLEKSIPEESTSEINTEISTATDLTATNVDLEPLEITPVNSEVNLEASLELGELEIVNEVITDLTEFQDEESPDRSQFPPAEITKPEFSILVKLRYAGLSDVGRERSHNEDGFRCISQTMTTASHNQEPIQIDRGLFILCDGMGGHEGGEIASGMALDLIAESFKPFWTSGLPGRQTLKEIIAIANQAIYNRNEIELRREMGRMGTTLVILIIYGNEVAIAHVGDSRIYKINTEGLTQITRDHEVGIKLIDRGMDEATANSRPDAHQLTQALGPNLSASLEPAIEFFKLDDPTLFLLCSDGLSDNQIVETQAQELMSLLPIDSDLKVGVKNLIQLGNDRNGHDNISAILVHYQIN